MGWGFRHFLFEQDGTMRHLSQRMADDVANEQDFLPQYAGYALRHASSCLKPKTEAPARLSH
jgi:hypothetical protein